MRETRTESVSDRRTESADLPADVQYKEVVIIGNGPSGMSLSYMLAGHVPWLRLPSETSPPDEMLRARLAAEAGKSLLDVDLMALAEGLEGRSHNPIPLLMDNLLYPCADLGQDMPSLVEWTYDPEREIDHVVLGRGAPGGAWPRLEPSVLTLSPARWLALPPHRAAADERAPLERVPARRVARYYERYVEQMGLQKYFRSGVIVTSVRRARHGRACAGPAACAARALWCVEGYDTVKCRAFRYVCARLVLAAGAGERPAALPNVRGALPGALRGPTQALQAVLQLHGNTKESIAPVLVVGSGLSAADAVVATRAARVPVAHVYRPHAKGLRGLSPSVYPEYHNVYQMMCDGPGKHENYIALPEHALLESTIEGCPDEYVNVDPKITKEFDWEVLTPKRVKLMNLNTNQITEMTVSLITICIGTKPDLHFLPANFDEGCINISSHSELSNGVVEPLANSLSETTVRNGLRSSFGKDVTNIDGKTLCVDGHKSGVCIKCAYNCGNYKSLKKKSSEKICSSPRQFCLKSHWHSFKNVIGQSIQSCKVRNFNNEEDDVVKIEVNDNPAKNRIYVTNCVNVSDNIADKYSLNDYINEKDLDCKSFKLTNTTGRVKEYTLCDCYSNSELAPVNYLENRNILNVILNSENFEKMCYADNIESRDTHYSNKRNSKMSLCKANGFRIGSENSGYNGAVNNGHISLDLNRDADDRPNKKTCALLDELIANKDSNISELLEKNPDVLVDLCQCKSSGSQGGVGLGFGVDPEKPVDCRSNPIDIDKTTHEVRNAPKGMFALGPLTGDNFVRFIPGGALAIFAQLWRERNTNCEQS